MGSNANDRIHQLVEQATVRNNQVASCRPPQKAMQRLTCTQEECPIALPLAANGIIGGDVGRLWLFSHFFRSKPSISPIWRSSKIGSNFDFRI